MNNFYCKMKSIENKDKISTENGATAYRTSGSELVDLNFKSGTFRNESEDVIVKMFTSGFVADKKLALKWLFFYRDCRGGMGERKGFRSMFKSLSHRSFMKDFLPLIPEYGRWDDLVDLMDTDLCPKVLQIIREQLEKDIVDFHGNKSISLLAKWLPSINCSSKSQVFKAKRIAKYLKWDYAKYRKTLSTLRCYLDVVEKKMCSNSWSEIDYQKVPSVANLKYADAFNRHDHYRRGQFLENVKNGEAKINSGVNYPHNIYSQLRYFKSVSERETLEELWKALPDYCAGKDCGNTICVVDGSGSMMATISNKVRALDVAQSLGIYFAEHCVGEFHNKFITFSEHPRLVDLSKCTTLLEKQNLMYTYDECANTDICKVMELILKTAVDNKLDQKDIPNVLILSDMQFDRGANISKPLFEEIAQKWADHGYKLPRISFWNIVGGYGRSTPIPLQTNEYGISLVSGFSPAIADMIYTQTLDPFKVLVEKLNSPRYDPVQKVLDKYPDL